MTSIKWKLVINKDWHNLSSEQKEDLAVQVTEEIIFGEHDGWIDVPCSNNNYKSCDYLEGICKNCGDVI